MLDILDNSAAKCGLISFKAPYVFRRDFSTNFSVKWMHKDIGLMLESAKSLSSASTDGVDPAAVPGGHRQGLRRRGYLLYYQGFRGDLPGSR